MSLFLHTISRGIPFFSEIKSGVFIYDWMHGATGGGSCSALMNWESNQRKESSTRLIVDIYRTKVVALGVAGGDSRTHLLQ